MAVVKLPTSLTSRDELEGSEGEKKKQQREIALTNTVSLTSILSKQEHLILLILLLRYIILFLLLFSYRVNTTS